MSTPVAEWVPDLSTFASRLAVVRHRMQWNAKEAALACGFPQSSWRNWEAGKRPQDFAFVCQAIADKTGVSAMWLAFGPEASRATAQVYSGEERRKHSTCSAPFPILTPAAA